MKSLLLLAVGCVLGIAGTLAVCCWKFGEL